MIGALLPSPATTFMVLDVDTAKCLTRQSIPRLLATYKFGTATSGHTVPAREDDHGGLRPWSRTFFPPDDNAWMDIHEHVCTRSRPARPSHRRFSRRLTSLVPRLMRIGTTKMRSIRCFFCFSSPQASYLEGMYMDNIPHHKDFTRSTPGDCSAFLCHFLGPRGKRSTCAV